MNNQHPAALWLLDLWPAGIPATDIPRAVALVMKLTGTSAPRPPPAKAAPQPTRAVPVSPPRKRGRPAKAGSRGPGRPPKAVNAGDAQPLRVRIQALLSQHPDGLTGAQIADTLNAPPPSVYSAVREIAERRNGRFVLAAAPERTPLENLLEASAAASEAGVI